MSFYKKTPVDQNSVWTKVKISRAVKDSFLLSPLTYDFFSHVENGPDGKLRRKDGKALKKTDVLSRPRNAFVRVKVDDGFTYWFSHLAASLKGKDTLQIMFGLGDEAWFVNMNIKVAGKRCCVFYEPANKWNAADYKKHEIYWTAISHKIILDKKHYRVGDSLKGQFTAAFYIESRQKDNWKGKQSWKNREDVTGSFKTKIEVYKEPEK